MRLTGPFVLILFALPLFADVDDARPRRHRAPRSGRYDEAIAKYKAALAEDPSSALAGYELAYTYHAQNDTANCIATLEPRVRAKNPYLAQMYAILGNCYDVAGDPKRAIDAYRKGLKIDGDETQLLYNLAVTLASTGEQDEARTLLKKELTLDPAHRSGHYLLAWSSRPRASAPPRRCRTCAFLSLEPEGPARKTPPLAP
jgi:tetratricopeptide (TPR) repeat protein